MLHRTVVFSPRWQQTLGVQRREAAPRPRGSSRASGAEGGRLPAFASCSNRGPTGPSGEVRRTCMTTSAAKARDYRRLGHYCSSMCIVRRLKISWSAVGCAGLVSLMSYFSVLVQRFAIDSRNLALPGSTPPSILETVFASVAIVLLVAWTAAFVFALRGRGSQRHDRMMPVTILSRMALLAGASLVSSTLQRVLIERNNLGASSVLNAPTAVEVLLLAVLVVILATMVATVPLRRRSQAG